MAFEKQQASSPTAITTLSVVLNSPDPRNPAQPSANFRVGVLYSDNQVKYIEGDLVPHLTQNEITQLLSFLATLRTRATQQLLP